MHSVTLVDGRGVAQKQCIKRISTALVGAIWGHVQWIELQVNVDCLPTAARRAHATPSKHNGTHSSDEHNDSHRHPCANLP
jgi:hypothetical protein